MNARRNWTRARSDAATAAETLTDAASLVGSGLATRASEGLGRASEGLSRASGGLDGARETLARAIEPAPRTRRLPWLLAVLGLTALSLWGWRLALRREPLDPGTPVPTTAPGEGELFGRATVADPDR